MEFIKQNFKTFLLSGLFLLIALGIMRAIFSPHLTALAEEREEKREQLEAYENLIRQEDQYKKLLEPFKLQTPKQTIDAALQDWVNALLRFASENGMVFEKVEPDKRRMKSKDQEMQINLMFRGDVQKLLYFLQYLMQENPLASVEQMKISQGEGKKDYLYEIVLGKAMS